MLLFYFDVNDCCDAEKNINKIMRSWLPPTATLPGFEKIMHFLSSVSRQSLNCRMLGTKHTGKKQTERAVGHLGRSLPYSAYGKIPDCP